MPLVINSLKGGHTRTQMHTNAADKAILKNQAHTMATGWHVPDLKGEWFQSWVYSTCTTGKDLLLRN